MIFRKRNSELGDSNLVHKYQKTQHAKYIGFLFDRYGTMVYGVCFKYLKNEDDSKDAVIKIFEKLMEDLKNTSVKHFKSWLYMVSKNHCLMILRKKKVDLASADEIQLEADEYEPNKFAAEELRFKQLDEAIKQLKPDQKNCVMKFYIEEMSYQQIVDSTDYSMKEVKSNIQNGKRNLKIILERNLNPNG